MATRLLTLPRRLHWRVRIRRWGIGYPDAEMRALAQLCDPTALSVDVGASLGTYTVHLLAHSAAVWAFEPRAAAIPDLRRMFAGAPVALYQMALSDRDGEAPFVLCTADPGRSTLAATNPIDGETAMVPVRRLDSLEPPRVGFVKIDVEGHEDAVLRGAWRMLARDRPNLLIEIEERHAPGATRRVPATLAALGYTGWFLDERGTWRPLSSFDPAVHQRVGETPYHNNFVFVTRSHPAD